MAWNVENTDEFTEWWDELTDAQQEDITATAELLMEHGPNLPFPHSSGIENSRHGHMWELRVQSGGHPIRIFYAFDPRRSAILLIGGTKRATIAFTRERYLSRTNFMTCTSMNLGRRV
jgi:hypothetical protein